MKDLHLIVVGKLNDKNIAELEKDYLKRLVSPAVIIHEVRAHSENLEKEVIQKAKVTADEIIKEAREQASDIVKNAEEDSKQKTEKTLKDARSQIELETSEAQKQLNKYVLELSLELLKRTLSKTFTEKDQSEIVQRAVKEMQKPN